MHGTARIRPAGPSDRGAIEALLAPEVAAGTLLPRSVDPTEFLVADGGERGLVGAVGLAWWTADVVELGSLVAAVSGEGIGSRLVDAVLDRAAREGARSVVALTALDGWFQRRGFGVHPVAPWALARRSPVLVPGESLHIDAALGQKATGSCHRCPRLAGCSQHLMVRAVHARSRRVA